MTCHAMDSPHEEMAAGSVPSLQASIFNLCPIPAVDSSPPNSGRVADERTFVRFTLSGYYGHAAGSRHVTRGPHRPGRLRGRRYLPNCGAAGGTAGRTA